MKDNHTPSTIFKKLPRQWIFWLIAFALALGLVLSIMAWLEICVEHCSANQDYRLFGLPFSYIGMSFFVAALLAHFYSVSYPLLKSILGYLTALALGAEVMFLGIQRNEIGHWCPICVSIAATIAFVALILAFDYFRYFLTTLSLNHWGKFMDIIKRGFASLSLALIGFVVAFYGVSKFDYAEAAMNEMEEKLAFGNKNSSIDVYFVTDWYCPSCKRAEPLIEKVLPLIQNRAKFYFIDYPIHKKSVNFTPYNLAFMLQDKSHYLKARSALTKLASQTENPTDQDVEKLAQQENLNFHELSFIQVKAGMEFFDQTVKKYQLNATPVLIITNHRTNQVVKLEGTDEIKDHKILEVVNSMQKQ